MVSGPGRLFAVLVLLGLPSVAAAQTPLKSELGREQRRFQLPQLPKAQPAERFQPLAVPALRRSGRQMDEAPAPFVLRALRVTGSTVYDDAVFRPLYAEFLGRQVTLEELRTVSKRITKKYADDGYVISRAAAPEKDSDKEGAVVIRVIEGYIERVEWPATISRYRDFFSDYAAKITADRPLNVRTLEHYLKTSDLPGLKFAYKWKALRTRQGRLRPDRDNEREAARSFGPARQSRHQPQGTLSIAGLGDLQQFVRPARAAHLPLCQHA